MIDERVLEVKNLKTYFFTNRGVVKAVDGVSFHINQRECVGLVGESGCGKTVTSLSIMRLVPPPGQIVEGQSLYRGTDLRALGEQELRAVRGNEIAMIFQNPVTSLNPVFTVGKQIMETIKTHRGSNASEARQQAREMLELVGIPDPEQRLRQYPHEFSGGMCQRIMIAIALCCNPNLLIADEPTTALDVTIQAQIIDLVQRLREKLDMAVIWITHDLGVIARLADRVLVMYAGHIIESGSANEIYDNPRHPYTLGLLDSIPVLDAPVQEMLTTIEGMPPDLIDMPPGCLFAPRCSYAMDHCLEENPPLLATDRSAHESACWRWRDIANI